MLEVAHDTDTVHTIMKKTILLMAAICLFSAKGFANDDEDDKKWGFYDKGGYSSLKWDTDGGGSTDLRGVHFEAGAVYNIQKNVPLMFGLAFKDYSKSEYKVKTRADILEVPVTAGYDFKINEKIGVIVHAGPYLDYVVNGYTKYDGEKFKFKDDDDFKEFGVGAKVGAIIHIYGFDIIGEYGYNFTERAKDTKESYWTIGIGYAF